MPESKSVEEVDRMVEKLPENWYVEVDPGGGVKRSWLENEDVIFAVAALRNIWPLASAELHEAREAQEALAKDLGRPGSLPELVDDVHLVVRRVKELERLFALYEQMRSAESVFSVRRTDFETELRNVRGAR